MREGGRVGEGWRVGGVQYVRGGRLLDPELCLITYSSVQPLLVPAAASYNCTGIAWNLALPAAGIAWLNFLESPPPPCYLLACLHASSASSADEQDVRHRIFLLLNGKCLNSRFHN